MKRKQRRNRSLKALGLLVATTLLAGSTTAADAAPLSERVTPNGQTQTTVYKADTGAHIVDIANPNNAGISNNKYRDFNVTQKGLVLNNSLDGADTVSAGWIKGNAHLNDPAHLIVNEVTSARVTTMNGALEVGGEKADVLVANPNGIRVEGGSFINVGDATLSTGRPEYDAYGNLQDVRVERGTITVNGELDAKDTSALNILSRAVEVNNAIRAQNLNVVTGQNAVNTQTGYFEKLKPVKKYRAPKVALDTSELGGMYAGQIVMVGTEDGLGVNQHGTIQADNILIDEAGNLLHTGNMEGQSVKVNVAKDIDIQAGTLKGKETLEVHAGNDLNITGINDVVKTETKGDVKKLEKNVKETTSTAHEESNFKGATLFGCDTILSSGHDVNVTGAQLKGYDYTISGENDVKIDAGISSVKDSKTVSHTKGSWHNNVTEGTEKTTASVTNGKIYNDFYLVAGNDMDITGLNIDAANGIYLSANGHLNANSAKSSESTFKNIDIARETAKLITGTTDVIDKQETLARTTLHSGNELQLIGCESMDLKGVDGKADWLDMGSNRLVVDADKEVKSLTDHAAYKRWGGLGGKDKIFTDKTDEKAIGSDLKATTVNVTVGGDADIIGSSVIGTESAVLQSDGKLSVTEAIERSEEHNYSRTGTVFNIKKDKKITESFDDKVKESKVDGTTNLAVAAKDLLVSGSTLAGDVLTVDAENIETRAAAGTQTRNQKTFGWETSAKAKLVPEKLGVRLSASLGTVRNTDNKTDKNLTKAVFAGKDVKIFAADKATLGGAKISGDKVDVTATDLTLDATKAESTKKDRTVRAGVTIGVDAGLTDVTPFIGINGTGETTTTTSDVVAGTSVDAKDITLNGANSVTMNGANVKGDNVSVTGGTVTNGTVDQTTTTVKKDRSGGVEVFGMYYKNTNWGAGLSANGAGTTTTTTTTNQNGSEIAGGTIAVTGTDVKDAGTKYTGSTVTINADGSYTATVATNTTNEKMTTGNGSLGFSTTRKGCVQNFSGDIAAAGGSKVATSTDQTGVSVTGDNVAINATGAVDATIDVKATGDVSVTGSSVSLGASADESTDRSISGAGSFSGAGNLCTPTGFGVGGSGSYEKNHSYKETGSTLEGATVSVVSGGDLTGKGAVLRGSDSVNTTAEGNINLGAADSNSKNVAVSGGAEVNIGKAGCSYKLTPTPFSVGGKVSVAHAEGETLGSIEGGNVAVEAGGDLALQSNVKGQDVSLSGENTTLDGAVSNDHGVTVGAAVDVYYDPVKLKGNEKANDYREIVKSDLSNDTILGVGLGKTGGEFAYTDVHATTKATVEGDNVNITGRSNIPVTGAVDIKTQGEAPTVTQKEVTPDHNHDIGAKLYVNTPSIKDAAKSIVAGEWVGDKVIDADVHFTWVG